MAIDIAALKDRQDDRDARSLKLRADVRVVSEGFVERITEFTQQAIAAGLCDVQAVKILKQAPLVIESSVNGFLLVCVVAEEILPLDIEDNPLAGRILVYDSPNPGATPFVDVIVKEVSPGSRWFVRGSLTEKPRILASGDVSGNISKEQGRRAADVVIGYISRFQHVWADTPSLESVLSNVPSKKEVRPIGFQP